MTPDRWADLRAAAAAATPGPWLLRLNSRVLYPHISRRADVPDLIVSFATGKPEDMRHVAAASPDVVQALLAERDAMLAALRAFLDAFDVWVDSSGTPDSPDTDALCDSLAAQAKAARAAIAAAEAAP